MQGSTQATYQLELLEYVYLVEDTPPNARVMKVYCPKIMGGKTGSKDKNPEPVDKSAFANDSSSELSSDSTIQSQNYIEARVALELAHRHDFHDCPGTPCPNKVHTAFTCHGGISELVDCPHYHHDHHFPHMGDIGLIPAGTKMIACFMNHDPNDCIITRMCCEFPGGIWQPGTPPRERVAGGD